MKRKSRPFWMGNVITDMLGLETIVQDAPPSRKRHKGNKGHFKKEVKRRRIRNKMVRESRRRQRKERR